jgi:hypothetical protein
MQASTTPLPGRSTIPIELAFRVIRRAAMVVLAAALVGGVAGSRSRR